MKYLRYMGQFTATDGTAWRTEIMQEADAAYAQVGVLNYPYDTPLTIEWKRKGKEEVICSSTATLTLISPADRTYTDLYSIETGQVRLDVYRNNVLYWSGCLDTEFYEEPYERSEHYEVSLTFSDFGVLDRLAWDVSGLVTIEQALTACLQRCGILYNAIDQTMISTSLQPDASHMTLSDLQIRSDNFYDEDGEAATLQEVVEGMLQPLSLRMIQRAGRIWVYDLNGLYHSSRTEAVHWSGDSQTLGADTVYNNARITWSTYAQSGNLYPTECWGDIKTDPNLTALDTHEPGIAGHAFYYSYYQNTDISQWNSREGLPGFTVWLSRDTGRNADIAGGYGYFYKLVPQEDGEESDGIAIGLYSFATKSTGGLTRNNLGAGVTLGQEWGTVGNPCFRTKSIWLPHVKQIKSYVESLNIRIAIKMLMDVRTNPFEGAANLADGFKQEDYYSQMEEYGNIVYVPVCIKFQPDGSDKVYVWDNRSVVTGRHATLSMGETLGYWEYQDNDSTTPEHWGYLCYRDIKDMLDKSGVLGWQTNKPAIAPLKAPGYKRVAARLKTADGGQYIPYPNFGTKGGRLWIEVYDKGWYIADGRDEPEAGKSYSMSQADNGKKQLWNKVNWVLVQLPEIEVINAVDYNNTIDTDDVEYSATLHPSAKEPIEIDTVCGTSADGVPMSRGAYFSSASGEQITSLTRAGRTSQAEDLLIGTLYSQYASRHTTLAGEASILCTGLCTYTEAAQGDTLFIAVEDVQDVRAGTSEAVFVELSPDEYKRDNED